MRFFTLFTLIILLNSCSDMKPIDFKDQKPRLIIEDYLSGSVKAWGILQNRSGKVTRQFSADLNGKWDGTQLVLDEKFNWSDGEIQTRQWNGSSIIRIRNCLPTTGSGSIKGFPDRACGIRRPV